MNGGLSRSTGGAIAH